MRCRLFSILVLLFLFSKAHVVEALQLKMAPLIGGPSWLPLHVKVIVEQNHTWDFVPLNATSPQTLQSLLSLRSVPGVIRHRCSSGGHDVTSLSPSIRRAQEFVDAYKNRDLHLINNNCWTFALMLYWHLLQTSEEGDVDLSSS